MDSFSNVVLFNYCVFTPENPWFKNAKLFLFFWQILLTSHADEYSSFLLEYSSSLISDNCKID